ncbi:MAG: carbon-nitrogen hydrolase family protein [Paracoccaceae bacterium]
MRAGLVQLNSGDDPAANLPAILGYISEAAAGGATFVATPEVSNMVSSSRSHQRALLRTEAQDDTLAALSAQTAALGIWLLVGSLALLSDAPGEDRFANRSLLIDPKGRIVARYDKIHMFDVDLDGGETYRESAGFAPGNRAVLARTGIGRIGMTVCYDMRFAALYRALAKVGAEIITVPAAFTVPTGRAHWHVLLRARAIETGAFIIAPAQCGQHVGRKTYGHSLVVNPWGEVIAEAGETPGVTFADIDLNQVGKARARIPSLTHDRAFELPA